MAAKPTHGLRQLERRIQRNRLSPRDRQALRKLNAAIVATPIEFLRDTYRGRVTRKEYLCQQGEMAAIADPNFAGHKWLGSLWNSLRRDVELLTMLEAAATRDADGPTFAAYLAAHATQQAPPQPASAAPTRDDEEDTDQ